MGTLVPMVARDPFDRLVDRCEWQGDCLVWTGTVAGTKSSYGMFRPTTRQEDPKVYVHRWIFKNTIGPLGERDEVDHVRQRGCTSTLCVNPEHLEAVTHAENSRRARLDTCRSGKHKIRTDEDAHWDKQGRRRGCRHCRNERRRLRDAAQNGGQ